MLIRVDAERCAGHAMCEALAGHVYRLDEVSGRNEMGEFQAAEELRTAALRGARGCPEQAISIEEVGENEDV